MKFWKRCGRALFCAAALLAVLAGAALAAEPAPAASAAGASSSISVQLNGELLSFSDAAPEAVDQRTFLPFRTLLEAMGAQVDYDAQTATVTAQRGGVRVSMVLGEKRATVVENGQTRTLEMDAAAYAKNNRTYIPVRFAAEALGCSVGWDQQNQTVILVDVDALFGGATFQLLDRFAAYCAKQDAPEDMSLSGNLTLDLSDPSGENLPQPIHVQGAAQGLMGKSGLQLTAGADLSALATLLPDDSSRLMLEPFLSDLNVEVRADLESETLYLYGAAPALLLGGQSADNWYSLDLSAYSAQLLELANTSTLAQLEDASVGEALAWVIRSMPLDSVDAYSGLDQVVSIYTGLFSDQVFTKEGNVYTAQALVENILATTITLTEQGEDIVALDVSMAASSEEPGMAMALTMTEHAQPDKVTLEMDMSLSSAALDMQLHFELSCLPADKAPETRPPAGAVVVPIN